MMELLEEVMANSELDSEQSLSSRCEEIESLILTLGWNAVYDYLVTLLSDDSRDEDEYHVVAEVIWGGSFR